MRANHCNGQFRADEKWQLVHTRRLAKQYSRCHCSAMSELRRGDQHPLTCKACALRPPAQRALRSDHYMDDCTVRAVRALPRSAPRLRTGIAMGMGTTHDVKSSKKSKNGAASNLFQVMTIAASIQEAVICCQCLMICKKIKQR